MLGLLLSGCGGGGSGASPGPSSPAAGAATTIDLAPGQTSAVLGWAPSRGPVDDYLVLQSRNGGAWTFLARVRPPRIEVRGQPGDEIQIMTIAEGSNGSSSDPSPPSPILRFRAPAPPPASARAGAVTAITSGSSSVAEPLSPSPTDAPETSNEATTDVARRETTAPEHPDARDSSGAEEPTSEAGAARLRLSLRDRLLRADPRFAAHRLSPRAAHWLAERVAEEPTAGVTLVGSGRRDADAWSELVWWDAAGQLFVSDGAATATRDDLSQILEETIRLRATERFAGLVDLDGDATGDWLIEETITGGVWIVDGVTGETRASRVGAEPGPVRLAGHGDFDGDGRVELVWRRDDDSLFLGREDGEADGEGSMIPVDGLPPLPTEALLAIADFDGDGRDDLATRSTEGRIELLLSRPLAGVGAGFERLAGPEVRIEGLDLMASLDLDGDGAAELVWYGEDALEIWDARRGPLGRIVWTEDRGFEARASAAEFDGDGDRDRA